MLLACSSHSCSKMKLHDHLHTQEHFICAITPLLLQTWDFVLHFETNSNLLEKQHQQLG